MRLICSTIGGGGVSDADIEDETEGPVTEHEWEGSQKNKNENVGEIEETRELSEIEVSAHELYKFETHPNFMLIITVTPLNAKQEVGRVHLTATMMAPLMTEKYSEKVDVKDNWKF